MMLAVFNSLQSKADSETELFFTAPSPGTVALFMENLYYPDYQTYLEELGSVLRQEYQIIADYGIQLQIDCPDLAMGRHTRYKNLDEPQFLSLMDANIDVLNGALSDIDSSRCRVHICWGNYAGTHHCDIELATILPRLIRLDPRFISLESCNHRHAHEWQVFSEINFPEDKVLLPGVIDTTSNTVEHPDLVAQRLENFANLLGNERVIGSTDCGFASTSSATSVSGEVAWLKLAALTEGAAIVNRRMGCSPQ
jgi:5-methyltetrahydropteroyltriglutamate--homocysteine methyltransferase